MKKEHFMYPSADGKTQIHAISWTPTEEGPVRAVLQIAHGMSEYIDRYDEFASFLAGKGFLVTGNDHLGHGLSVQSEKYYGYFAEDRGNAKVLEDIHRLRKMTQETYPGVSYFVLGHSMGSFLMRQYICEHGPGLAGAIIMGTGYQGMVTSRIGMSIAMSEAQKNGWFSHSGTVDNLALGSYNKRFGKKGGFEWLSRNEENVRKYVADPHCGFSFTLNGYYNLFLSLNRLTDRSYLQGMPKDLPILFASGSKDPVGGFGNGVERVVTQFQSLGMRDVNCYMYAKDRHEILNEVDKERVFGHLYDWLEMKKADQ